MSEIEMTRKDWKKKRWCKVPLVRGITMDWRHGKEEKGNTMNIYEYLYMHQFNSFDKNFHETTWRGPSPWKTKTTIAYYIWNR